MTNSESIESSTLIEDETPRAVWRDQPLAERLKYSNEQLLALGDDPDEGIGAFEAALIKDMHDRGFTAAISWSDQVKRHENRLQAAGRKVNHRPISTADILENIHLQARLFIDSEPRRQAETARRNHELESAAAICAQADMTEWHHNQAPRDAHG